MKLESSKITLLLAKTNRIYNTTKETDILIDYLIEEYNKIKLDGKE